MKLEKEVRFQLTMSLKEARKIQTALHSVLVQMEELNLPCKLDGGECLGYIDTLGRLQQLFANDNGEVTI